jgi:hypothetical protein
MRKIQDPRTKQQGGPWPHRLWVLCTMHARAWHVRHWVPQAESHRRICQEGHVGDGSPESTSARSQGRAAPAIALRPPPCFLDQVRSPMPACMHEHLPQNRTRWQCLSCSHISCLAMQSAVHARTQTNNNTCAQWRLSLVPSQSVDSSITTVLGGKWRPLVWYHCIMQSEEYLASTVSLLSSFLKLVRNWPSTKVILIYCIFLGNKMEKISMEGWAQSNQWNYVNFHSIWSNKCLKSRPRQKEMEKKGGGGNSSQIPCIYLSIFHVGSKHSTHLAFQLAYTYVWLLTMNCVDRIDTTVHCNGRAPSRSNA